jgi:hypothetical protein
MGRTLDQNGGKNQGQVRIAADAIILDAAKIRQGSEAHHSPLHEGEGVGLIVIIR